MDAWSADERGRGRGGNGGDGMGPSVTSTSSARRTTPPLKNGNELRAQGYLIAVGSRTARFRRKHKNKLMLTVLLALLLLLLCLFVTMTVLYARLRRQLPTPLCKSRECVRSAANLVLSMDPSADPCDDFYQFACGSWSAEHPRPDALRSLDWFREKQTRVYAAVRDVLTRNLSVSLPATATAPSIAVSRPLLQAKDLYDACMDTETLDKLGLKPAISVLESVGLPAYPTYVNVTEDDHSGFEFDWLGAAIRVKTQLGMDVLVGFDIFTDPRNSTLYRLVMGSPETTNPFPSMHNEKKRHVGRRSIRAYQDLIDQIFLEHTRGRGGGGTSESDKEKEERMARELKVFYADLMKLFILETPEANTTKHTELELDNNILIATNEFYILDSELYELESNNDTEPEEDLYANIPEYTAVELEEVTGAGQGVWARYLLGVFNVSDVTLDLAADTVLVSEPDRKYLKQMYGLVAQTPPLLMELYMWMKVVEVMAVHTTTEVRSLWWRAQQTAAQGRGRGASGEATRGLQCAGAANDLMGLAVASAIVDPHFLNVTKPKVERMLFEMKNALSRLVGRARWMDDDTKLATYQKIVNMRSLVGFPDWLLRPGALADYYRGIEVGPTTHLDNMVNIIQVKIRKALNKFREGNNVTWATDPTEVNAYHTFQENTINLRLYLDAAVPLVMLQYPFFDLGLDSLNYGSLGTILGHEITHGFDNFGRQFDKSGNLVPWWSNETVAGFLNVTRCFIDQYNQYYVPELDEYVDGMRTLGENIADAGGVREALVALREHLRATGPEPRLPGLERYNAEQLFFLSYGNLWCGEWTREALAADLRDEHAPQRLRAAGALRNAPEFAHAWHCPPGTPMNPPSEDRCIVF